MTKQPLFQENHAVFMYHSRSKDVAPGKGTGETLSNARDGGDRQDDDYSQLSQIPDWRKRLSNFDESPFALDGHRWKSVEHYFQAQKFKTRHPQYYHSFCLDSGSALSQATGAAVKRAGGKSVMRLADHERRAWESVKYAVMERALWAKFGQNPEPHGRVLLATGFAKLTHKPLRSRRTIVEYGLMKVRRRLRLLQQDKKNGGAVARLLSARDEEEPPVAEEEEKQYKE